MTDLRALAEAATPGPWSSSGLSMRPFTVYDDSGEDLVRAWLEADAALIAAMRNALPALLDVYEAARPFVDGYDPDLPGLEEDEYRLLRALARAAAVMGEGVK